MPLTPPPRDEAGNVVAHDHDGILADDVIIRRVSERQVVKDANGNRRIASILYKASSGTSGMSINIEKLIAEAGKDPRQHVTTPRWTGSVYFTAGTLRALGFSVGFEPIDTPPEHADPYHGEVWGTFTDAQREGLKLGAQWYVAIEGVALA